MRQGERLSKDTRDNIVRLLTLSDTSIVAISKRTGISASTIVLINKVDHIRDYHGRKATWTVDGQLREES